MKTKISAAIVAATLAAIVATSPTHAAAAPCTPGAHDQSSCTTPASTPPPTVDLLQPLLPETGGDNVTHETRTRVDGTRPAEEVTSQGAFVFDEGTLMALGLLGLLVLTLAIMALRRRK